MALHEIPADGRPHSTTSECACGPQRRAGVHQGHSRTVYAHRTMPPSAGAEADDDYDETFGGAQ